MKRINKVKKVIFNFILSLLSFLVFISFIYSFMFIFLIFSYFALIPLEQVFGSIPISILLTDGYTSIMGIPAIGVFATFIFSCAYLYLVIVKKMK